MANVHIEKTTWDLSMHSLGWQGPIGDSLWEHFGGGPGQDLNWEIVYRTIMSVGWTAQHAETLWKSLAAHNIPVPPEPSIVQADGDEETSPVEQIAQVAAKTEAATAPWERGTVEDPLEQETEKKKTKAPKAPKVPKATRQKKAKEPKAKKSLPSPDLGMVPKRLMATVIDAVVVVALAFGASTALGVKPMDMVGKVGAETDITKVLMAGLLTSLLSAAYFWLTMKRPDRTGQSLGKQIAGLKVVRQDTDPIDPRTIIMREMVGATLLPWLVLWQGNTMAAPAGYVVLAIMLLLVLRGKGIPDLVASTEVVEA